MFTNRARGVGRGNAPRVAPAPILRTPPALPARNDPDYEVVEFPTDQYVNAKIQPPPTPPRPAAGNKILIYI